MLDYWKAHKFPLLFVLASLLFYASFAYDLQRADTTKLLGLYIGLFFFFYKIIQFEKNNFRFLLLFGIASRFVFFAATPNLSQDFYRFIWDGKLLLDGINPFQYTVEQLLASDFFSAENYKGLQEGMGNLNASHYSNYPPINQLFFYLSALLGGKTILGNIIVLRSFIILSDIGILYFGRKILQLLQLPKHQIFWYFLNPFIIIELTGNLHFEGIMLFFFVVSLYFLLQQKWIIAALFLSISISTKLVPLLFLPLFLRWFLKDFQQIKGNAFQLIGFYSITILGFIASFLPFLSSELITNYTETIGLWFQKFEFNASIYYIVREIGFYRKGYNIIETAGTRMAIGVFIFIWLLAFLRKNNQPKTLFISMLLAVSFYLFMSTTIHPWYIATPLLLGVFTSYKYPIIWSAATVLSYHAYAHPVFQENLWIVTLEYLIIYSCFIYEVFFNKRLIK
ncbi:glycosyltransferase 87 family protein [Galbibacter orientalis]|uniref:glycosyltransferase 87 family protein n=1 Tax=Galbibacter orientalis TaxID=453852 RepID=UPI00308057DC